MLSPYAVLLMELAIMALMLILAGVCGYFAKSRPDSWIAKSETLHKVNYTIWVSGSVLIIILFLIFKTN